MSSQLSKAAEKGDVAAIQRLLDKGDDLEWTHKGTGRTALLEASIAGHHDAVAALLDHGSRIDHQCKSMGYTSLTWASANGALEIVDLLIARGANLDLASPELRRTALMAAAQSGRAGVVERLLRAGANPHLTDFKEATAWSLAEGNGHQAVLQILGDAKVGAPAPPAAPKVLAWPEASAHAKPTDDPVAVVRAYILAMDAWENKGNALPEGSTPEPAFWEEQLQIVARFCTQRSRVQQHSSYGFPTSHSQSDQLVSVHADSSSKTEVVILDKRTPLEYERQFVVHHKGGEWRIDSLKYRMRGTDKWDPLIL